VTNLPQRRSIPPPFPHGGNKSGLGVRIGARVIKLGFVLGLVTCAVSAYDRRSIASPAAAVHMAFLTSQDNDIIRLEKEIIRQDSTQGKR
jgi:hypothetical protein